MILYVCVTVGVQLLTVWICAYAGPVVFLLLRFSSQPFLVYITKLDLWFAAASWPFAEPIHTQPSKAQTKVGFASAKAAMELQ